MSTRCNVIVRFANRKASAILYHHTDGYPSFMAPKLEAFCEAIADTIHREGHIMSAAVFADLMVSYSSASYSRPLPPDTPDEELTEDEHAARRVRQGRPYFEHTDSIHDDIEYIWTITLDRHMDATIECEACRPFDIEESRTKIDYLALWRRELELEIDYLSARAQEKRRYDPQEARELEEYRGEVTQLHRDLIQRIKARG